MGRSYIILMDGRYSYTQWSFLLAPFQNWKIKSATFWAIFKHCVLVFYIDKKGRKRKSLIIVTLINEVAKEREAKTLLLSKYNFWFLLLHGIFSRSICLSYGFVNENQNHVLLVLTHISFQNKTTHLFLVEKNVMVPVCLSSSRGFAAP